jgi:hypothetical protein
MTIITRAQKILKYKYKVYKHREQIPVIRKFIGRSETAKNKVRVNGRFVKQERDCNELIHA